jgi:hypothetical protein
MLILGNAATGSSCRFIRLTDRQAPPMSVITDPVPNLLPIHHSGFDSNGLLRTWPGAITVAGSTEVLDVSLGAVGTPRILCVPRNEPRFPSQRHHNGTRVAPSRRHSSAACERTRISLRMAERRHRAAGGM